MTNITIKYPALGICGLACRLCPRYHTEGSSRCEGCKTESRMGAPCAFHTCALKRKGLEFCWDCPENESCERLAKHRQWGQEHDSFVCYQRLEANIALAKKNGVQALGKELAAREELLRDLLRDFNEGRSKSYYCIAATVMSVDELNDALTGARKKSNGLDLKEKSKVMHAILDEIAAEKGYLLKLRGWK